MVSWKTSRLLVVVAALGAAGCSEAGGRKIGESCTRDGECASSRCDELVCKSEDPGAEGAPCTHPLECLSENCEGDRCGPGTRDDGASCTEDEQCISGTCAAGSCGQASDAGVDSGLQPICAPFGPPTESPPATRGDARFVRPPFSEDSFCVQDAAIPEQGWGDTICRRDLGPAYVWGWDGAGHSEALEGGKEALAGDTSVEVLLIPPPNQAATSWEVYATNCSYETSWACGGVTYYPPECVPPASYRGKLWCTKRSQGPVALGVTDLSGPFDAAYDAVNARYVVAYATAEGISLTAMEAYGESTLPPFTIYRYTAGDIATVPPAPRLAMGENAGGEARLMVVWQHALSGSPSGAQRKRFATLNGDLGVVKPPVDFYDLDGFKVDGQHDVAFDPDHRRFFVVVAATSDGEVLESRLVGRSFDAEGRPLTDHVLGTGPRPPSSGAHTDYFGLTYLSGQGLHLLIAGSIVSFFDWENIDQLGGLDFSLGNASLVGAAANGDTAGYRLLISRDGVLSTMANGSNGALLGPERPFGTREVGGPLRIAYLPKSNPGTIKGKYLVQNGRHHLWLNDDGTTCFPTVERSVSDGSENGLLVANSDTGGFAYIYEEGGALYAKLYLSNGDEY